jgi:hypothetical protein
MNFSNIATHITDEFTPVYIIDNAGLKVSAKSLLGALYSMEFSTIWCECEKDIYTAIEKYIV